MTIRTLINDLRFVHGASRSRRVPRLTALGTGGVLLGTLTKRRGTRHPGLFASVNPLPLAARRGEVIEDLGVEVGALRSRHLGMNAGADLGAGVVLAVEVLREHRV